MSDQTAGIGTRHAHHILHDPVNCVLLIHYSNTVVNVGRPDNHIAATPISPDDENILVRGAVSMASDPIIVFWHGQHVALSKVESEVYAYIFRRGRVHVDEIDALLTSIGAKPETRSLVLGHIRGKFARLGACNPFERLGKELIRLRVDADANGRTAPVIGLTSSRYVRVGFPDT